MTHGDAVVVVAVVSSQSSGLLPFVCPLQVCVDANATTNRAPG